LINQSYLQNTAEYCTKLKRPASVCAEFSAKLIQSALNNCKYKVGQTYKTFSLTLKNLN